MRYFVVANPHARDGRSRRKVDRLRARLQATGARHDWATCEGLDHARVLSAEANRAGYDVVVAAGGDGTINRVLNGFFDPEGRRISRARMGVVYTGTSPDFCRSHRIPTGFEAALATLLAGVARPVSVGRIVYHAIPAGAAAAGAAGGEKSACFACCANVGLGAALARLANGGVRKYAGDWLGTLASLLQVLRRHRPGTVTVTLDGKSRTLTGVYDVAVGKTFHVASGLKVRHALASRDDRLYVVCLQHLTWCSLGRALMTLYGGRPIGQYRGLSLDYARQVSVASADDGLEVEFDGDPAGWCPCRVETAPDPLELLTEGCP
jgi:diacylglycerol kinase family enzyme